MITGFEKIVEERIQRARGKGKFENLTGTGRPLSMEDDQHIPEDLRLCYKILKNADCLPPALEIKKEIRQTEDLLAGMKDTAEKYRALKKINLLIMKLNALNNGPVELEIPQRYDRQILDRLS